MNNKYLKVFDQLCEKPMRSFCSPNKSPLAEGQVDMKRRDD